MSADPPLPRVGCGAAILKNGRLLLVRRRRNPEAGCWGLPGGKVDPFETVAVAAAREIHEELGITIAPIRMLCLVEQIDEEMGEHWISPVFRIDAFEGMPTIREPDALSDMAWFDLNALPTPLTVATSQALEALASSSAAYPAGNEAT